MREGRTPRVSALCSDGDGPAGGQINLYPDVGLRAKRCALCCIYPVQKLFFLVTAKRFSSFVSASAALTASSSAS